MNGKFHQRLGWITRGRAIFPATILLFSFAFGTIPTFASDPGDPTSVPAEAGPQHASILRTGVLPTREGLTLRLTTDLGSVNIVTLEANAAPVVRFSVRIETDAHGPIAQQLLDAYSLKTRPTYSGVEITGTLPPQASRTNAQFWVQYEITIPRGYSVDVNTEAGDITTADIGGTATIHTQGGNIRTGSIGAVGTRPAVWGRPVARLVTEGGHIQVAEVKGDLNAVTGGGHINVGNIRGDASLHTGGGHIRAGQIGGRADLDTVGGNITVANAASYVSVRTGGGQIDFGEVHGLVRAQTGGGGIRVMYVSGPIELESSSGSICLTRVAGAMQASTSGGTITAWINPDSPAGAATVRLVGPSQLASGNGDIIVYVPRNLAANIEAVVANGGERRIEADPALHLMLQPPSGTASARAIAVLNGGGAPLKIKTTGGKIRLQFQDSEIALRESLIREQIERLNNRMKENGFASYLTTGATSPGPGISSDMPSPVDLKTDWLESWLSNLEITFRGGITEDPDEFQKRLVNYPKPIYPALAQRAGLQGIVRLQVRVKKDGSLEVQKLLEGEPALADSAISAVKQWRARPALLNGKPVEVISIVTFNFQLH